MNGKRYLLDTNAIVALLQGHKHLLQQLRNAEWIGISIISQLEFLVFPNLTDSDKKYFNQFLQRVEVVGLTAEQPTLMATIIDLRQQHRLKLPDAIIAGTAVEHMATLITADKRLHAIERVSVWDFS